MAENLVSKDKKVKIVIYQGHIHIINFNDDIKDREQNLNESNTKNSGERCSIQ